MVLRLEGVIPAMVTLFKSNYELDEEAIRGQIDFLVQRGVHGILACGSLGEFAYMTEAERKKVAETAVDQANGRVPIMIGTASCSTDEAIRLTKHAKDIGADASVVVPPYYFVQFMKNEALYEHYRAIAEAVDFPIVIYNFPASNSINLDPALIVRLAQIPNIVGLKDSTDTLRHMQSVILLTEGKFRVITGSEDLMLPILMIGGYGTVTGPGNFHPDFTVRCYEAFMKGDLEKAKELNRRIMRMQRVLPIGRTGTIPVFKEAIRLTGRNISPTVRRPLLPLTDDERERLRHILKEEGII